MFYRWGGIFDTLRLRGCEGSSLMGMYADTVRAFSTGSIPLYSGDRNCCFLSIPHMCGHTLDMLCWRRLQSNCRGNTDMYYNAVFWKTSFLNNHDLVASKASHSALLLPGSLKHLILIGQLWKMFLYNYY